MRKVIKISLLLATIIVSGCVDLYDHVDTLVLRYTNLPWRTRTISSCPQDQQLYNLSYLIKNGKQPIATDQDHITFEVVDNIVNLYLPISNFRENVYDRNNNEEIFRSLCQKHGDISKSPVGCFSKFSHQLNFDFFYQDFTAIEVTCEEDFDSSHPAGASLLDIIHYATDTPNRVLKNNYQTKFNDNTLTYQVIAHNKWYAEYLTENYGDAPVFRQEFNTFKKGTDVEQDDLAILGEIFISFDKCPDVVGPKHINIRMTSETGEIYSYDTVLTFDTYTYTSTYTELLYD